MKYLIYLEIFIFLLIHFTVSLPLQNEEENIPNISPQEDNKALNLEDERVLNTESELSQNVNSEKDKLAAAMLSNQEHKTGESSVPLLKVPLLKESDTKNENLTQETETTVNNIVNNNEETVSNNLENKPPINTLNNPELKLNEVDLEYKIKENPVVGETATNNENGQISESSRLIPYENDGLVPPGDEDQAIGENNQDSVGLPASEEAKEVVENKEEYVKQEESKLENQDVNANNQNLSNVGNPKVYVQDGVAPDNTNGTSYTTQNTESKVQENVINDVVNGEAGDTAKNIDDVNSEEVVDSDVVPKTQNNIENIQNVAGVENVGDVQNIEIVPTLQSDSGASVVSNDIGVKNPLQLADDEKSQTPFTSNQNNFNVIQDQKTKEESLLHPDVQTSPDDAGEAGDDKISQVQGQLFNDQQKSDEIKNEVVNHGADDDQQQTVVNAGDNVATEILNDINTELKIKEPDDTRTDQETAEEEIVEEEVKIAQENSALPGTYEEQRFENHMGEVGDILEKKVEQDEEEIISDATDVVGENPNDVQNTYGREGVYEPNRIASPSEFNDDEGQPDENPFDDENFRNEEKVIQQEEEKYFEEAEPNDRLQSPTFENTNDKLEPSLANSKTDRQNEQYYQDDEDDDYEDDDYLPPAQHVNLSHDEFQVETTAQPYKYKATGAMDESWFATEADESNENFQESNPFDKFEEDDYKEYFEYNGQDEEDDEMVDKTDFKPPTIEDEERFDFGEEQDNVLVKENLQLSPEQELEIQEEMEDFKHRSSFFSILLVSVVLVATVFLCVKSPALVYSMMSCLPFGGKKRPSYQGYSVLPMGDKSV